MLWTSMVEVRALANRSQLRTLTRETKQRHWKTRSIKLASFCTPSLTVSCSLLNLSQFTRLETLQHFGFNAVIWDRVYFTTSNGKIGLYSVDTGDAQVIVDSRINMTSDTSGYHGITYDPVEKKIYFSSKDAIYRANPDGTGIELALSSRKCESRFGVGQAEC